MISRYLNYFRQATGCVFFEPAVESNLSKINHELTTRNFAPIPEEYYNFLKLTDGLIFNGIELYGSVPHYRELKEYTFPNLITVNEYYLNYDYFIRKLVIGRISENLLLYNENEKVYTIADRINLRPILECESFVAFLKIFYDHALPPNER